MGNLGPDGDRPDGGCGEVSAVILLLVAGLFALANAYYAWLEFRQRGEPHPSFAPFIGGVAGVAGLSLVPLDSISDRLPYLWLPFVLDAGSGAYLVGLAAAEIVRRHGE
ncbi:MAG TPA: hypothetical protein EYO90_07905 [Candidatus Latescibacteria bacterium]|nr:hypothetical protein [Candidatus Latescibacterota bacterium]